MKIKIEFTSNNVIAVKTIEWWNKIDEFPKFIEYNATNWKMLAMESLNNQEINYMLTFVPVSYVDPEYIQKFQSFESLFIELPTSGVKCECGAAFTSFSSIHTDWCPLGEQTMSKISQSKVRNE